MAVTKSEIPFKSYYANLATRKRCRINSGDRMKQEYQPVYNRAGVWHLEETKKTSLYLSIQSYAASCDINIIMARYRNGETDVLQQIQGVYGDFSNVPTNYADLMNAKLTAENLFNSLSAEVREKYNNSVTQFMAEIGTQAGLEKLGVKFNNDENLVGSPADAVKEGASVES